MIYIPIIFIISTIISTITYIKHIQKGIKTEINYSGWRYKKFNLYIAYKILGYTVKWLNIQHKYPIVVYRISFLGYKFSKL